MWIPPVFDRTQEDVNFARNNRNEPEHFKGAQNYSDWNRLTGNMHHLSELLADFGYSAPMTCRKNWTIDDKPSWAETTLIWADINRLMDTYAVISTTPDTPVLPFTHYQKINDIEKILFDIIDLVSRMPLAFLPCGDISAYSGYLDTF